MNQPQERGLPRNAKGVESVSPDRHHLMTAASPEDRPTAPLRRLHGEGYDVIVRGRTSIGASCWSADGAGLCSLTGSPVLPSRTFDKVLGRGV